MITEDYVSFETAKFLKEKGFGFTNCNTYYTLRGEVCEIGKDQEICIAPRPTLQMAMKWLREAHNIFIQVELYSKYNDYCFELFQNTHRLIIEKREVYNTYEETCEAAIKYCLKNLI